MLVGEVFARMGLDSKQYEKGLDRLEGYTQKRAMTLGSIFKGAFSFAIGIGVVQGFRSIGGAITDFVNTAARTDVLNIAIQSVAQSSGYMQAAVEADKRAVMEMGIAEQEATQITARFMQAQLDTADAAKIARTAQDAALIANVNSSQAAEQMTEAIAKQRPELLSQFGMTRNMNEIYKDYAGTVGKTAAQLSEAEKKQAMLNYILKEGEKIAGTYETSMGAVGKQISSLPRFWDTLKNAIARPLALPVLSVIVDGITNSLKSGIAWAEANKMTLQSWGQTAVNVATAIINAFRWVTKIFVENWATIRFAATAFLTYVAAAKTINMVSYAVRGLTLLMYALKGQALSSVGYFGTLAASVRVYQAASLGAAGATNIFTYSVHAASAAVKGFLASIPVVGWVLLALSAIVGGGMALWNKYTQSLQKASQSFNEADLRKRFRELEAQQKAALGAAKGQDTLTDAVKKSGKEAAKSLLPFDEIHTLQKDMAGLDDIGDLDMGLDVPELGFEIPDMSGMLDGFDLALEEAKPTFKGFLGWMWDEAKEWLSESKWSPLVLGLANPFLGLTHLIIQNWDWITEKAGDLWDVVVVKWDDFTIWAGNLWDGVKERWEGFKAEVKRKWEAFWTPIETKWNTFITWASNMWGRVKGAWDKIRNWSVWTWISNKVNWLKGVFDFKWSLPKIKLPHFTVTWSTAGFWAKVGDFLGLPGKPNIGVNWYRQGGIFSQPSVIGVGEAGREAVLPLDRNTGWMNELAAKIAAVSGSGGGSDGPLIIQVMIGGDKILEKVIDAAARKNAKAGRTVVTVGV